MIYTIFADLVLILHALFILFVVFGALLIFQWKRLIWVHFPCVVWGALLELRGWICPLTYLEVDLRRAAGTEGYSGGFVEHYLTPLVYPSGLTLDIQVIMGMAVILINLVIYSFIGWYWYQSRK
jgi:hypothetical protein